MNLELSTPALLFPAIAILMLGYVNRYVGTANVIRTFKKDYDSGYVHTEVVAQLKILKQRIQLSRVMLAIGAFAFMLSCLSMFLLFAGYQDAGETIFGVALLAMIISLLFAIRETQLSNRSLIIEIDDIFKREGKKEKSK